MGVMGERCLSSQLLTATTLGFSTVAQAILCHPEAGVNCTDSKNNQTPLHIATQNDDFTCITKLLLDHSDINVNSMDESSNTPLHFAAANGSAVNVNLLLSHPKIDVTLKNHRDLTPLDEAMIHQLVKKHQTSRLCYIEAR
ncbi:hypothetical protein AC1031_000040 [Aphanomyces cochlioides]|nr:hypothetical protein AC1031_000040 [Aphanomyces cochlioides]